MGSGESWFEPRRGNSTRGNRIAVPALGFPWAWKERHVSCLFTPESRRIITPKRSTAGGTLVLNHSAQGRFVRLLIAQQRTRITPPSSRGHVLQGQVLSLGRPGSAEHVPKASGWLRDLSSLERLLKPVSGQVPRHRPTTMPAPLWVRKE